MKFNLETAILYIIKKKDFRKNFAIICFFLLLYLLFGVIRSYFASYMYFDGAEEKMSLAVMNFTPNNIYSFIGFPSVASFLAAFDICRLAWGEFEIYGIIASGVVVVSGLILSFPVGYFIYNSHNRILYKEQNLVSADSFSDCFKKGLFAILGCIINSVPVLIIAILTCKLFFGYFDRLIIDNPDLVWLYTQMRTTASYIILCVCAFVMFLYLSAAILPYIVDLKLSSFFKLKCIFGIIFKNPLEYLKYIGFSVLFNGIFACLIVVLNCIFNVFKELMPFSFNGVEGLIYGDDLFLLLLSIVLILISLPFAFFLFSIVSDIQAQFINYLTKKNDR